MSDAILVLNAGSSSIKFSIYLKQGDELEPHIGGQLEGLYTAPGFKATKAGAGVRHPHYAPAKQVGSVPTVSVRARNTNPASASAGVPASSWAVLITSWSSRSPTKAQDVTFRTGRWISCRRCPVSLDNT